MKKETYLTPNNIQAFSLGFQAGNFQETYSEDRMYSPDFNVPTCEPLETVAECQWYEKGFLIGYFSSYEISEVPFVLADEIEYLRKHTDVREIARQAGIEIED